jgi:predicted nucleic acid-binding protein
LALSEAGKADYLVTGDKATQIISASDFAPLFA